MAAVPPPIYDTLVVNRAKYPTPMSSEQLGSLLNETAWAHAAQGWGLLGKSSGASVPQPETGIRIARDILANEDQQILVDVLMDAEGQGKPMWGTVKPLDKPFVAPVEAGGASGGERPIEPPPAAQIPYNESYAVEFGLACNDVYTESGATMDPGMIAVHASRAAWDYYVGDLSWDESYHKHVNAFRAEYGLPPV